MKICRLMLCCILAVAMTLTMMPLTWGAGSNAYAEAAAASGGIVASNSEADALAAFGSENVTVEDIGQGLIITLQKDITLSERVLFQQGNETDIIILDLNGHTIKGADGVSGPDYDAAQGGNAIEIAAGGFDLEITDSNTDEKGTVIGGEGAIYLNNAGYLEGERGGSAVFLVQDESNQSYLPGRLGDGLTVTGGVTLAGGAGADVDFDDWYANVCADPEFIKDSTFFIEAGRGGDAISQQFSGTDYGTTIREQTFAKICIVDGSVIGGAGGTVNMGDSHPFTQTAITGLQAIQNYMNRYKVTEYYSNISDRIRLQQGNGGNGIMFAAGRKYIDIEANGTVTGGSGGKIDYGKKGEKVNRIPNNYNFFDWNSDLETYNRGAGGAAICGWGDLGLTNDAASLSDDNGESNYWGTKTKESDDIGLYVAGSVRGGDACSTTAMCDYALEGGDGIRFNTNDARYCTSYDWDLWNGSIGIVFVDESGSVAGGNGGSAVNGNAGDGGSGIFENAWSSSLGAAVNHFVINGAVTGGNGGYSGSKGIATNDSLSPVTGSGKYGFGGNAIHFEKKLDQNKMVTGTGGVLQGGDYGCAAYRSGDKIDSQNRYLGYNDRLMFAPAVEANDDDTVEFYGTVTRKDGDYAYARKGAATGFKAAATMTPFTSGPTTKTILSCEVTTPADYDGKVYYKWCATLRSGSNYDTYDGDNIEYDIEGKGTAVQQFNLLSDADYHNTVSPGTAITQYGVHAVTANYLAERTKYNDNTRVTIYCYAMLEDGRYVKSNEIWFSKSKKSSTGWSGTPPVIIDPDQEAADAVMAMIEALPKLADITLDDMDAIAAAREAYEALNEEQKELLAPFVSLLKDLASAESKIAELTAGLIAALPDAELSLDDESAVIAARETYEKLSDAQKALIPDEVLTKLETAEGIIRGLNQDVVDSVEAQVNTLLEGIDLTALDSNDPDYATKLQTAKENIENAAGKYDSLTPTQLPMVSDEVKGKMQEAVKQYNDMFPDTPIVDPTRTPITDKMITVANAKYTGKALTPAVTVSDGNKILKEGTDYTKEYSNNTNAGKGKVTVTGEGDYRSTASKEFTINQKKITPAVTLSTAKYNWNGKARKPGVTVKDGTVKLPASQYTVSYASGRKNVGTYKVTVKLKGNYSGTKAVNFKIVPKGATIVKPKREKKALTVKWKKRSTKMSKSRITGYQVQCSTSKSFKRGVTKQSVKGYKKTSIKVSGLKGKKNYYVRVRTYMKAGGKTYYSKWSKVLKAKTK